MKKVSEKRRYIVLIGILLLVLALPLVIILLHKQTQPKSNATAATTLSFSPDTTTTPLQATVGTPVNLDVAVNPGTNWVSSIRLEIDYDPTKFSVPANGFTPNLGTFPNVIEGPFYSSGKVQVTLSVGADPTKALQVPGTAGTLTLNPLANTSTSPTLVSYSSTITEVTSIGPNDQTSENVLSATIPAAITITGQVLPTNTPTPTLTPSPTPTPTNTPTPTPTPSPTNTPTPTATPTPQPTNTPVPTNTPAPNATQLAINVTLHGIGHGGDNVNPGNFSSSNQKPLHPSRTFTVQITDAQGQVAATITDFLLFDATTGTYTGNLTAPTSLLSGDYTVLVRTNAYLAKRLPGIQVITANQSNTLTPLTLVAGDIDGNNQIDLLDYNILLDCGYGAFPALPMTDPNSAYHATTCQAHGTNAANADLNDDGTIDTNDYNLWIRELSVQPGQ